MNHDTIVTLNDLIKACKDGVYGFLTSAEYLRNSACKVLFMRRSGECREAVTELQALVRALGGSAEHSGTVAGTAHRGWVALKGTLSVYSDEAILEETERGEETALESYRSALTKDLPAHVRSVIERQYEGVMRNHVEARVLRDRARAATLREQGPDERGVWV